MNWGGDIELGQLLLPGLVQQALKDSVKQSIPTTVL